MKLRTLFLFLAASTLAFDVSAAQGPRRRGAAARAKTSEPSPSKDTDPARQLAPYIEHIDEILALRRAPAHEQTAGKVAVLKQAFATRRESAEGPQKAALNAAIATCDRLTAALDERSKALAQVRANMTVKGSDDLGERTKDSLVKDIRPGRGRGRAAEVELKREQREKGEARREAIERDQSMTARSVQRWNERTTELRKQITEAYSRISAA
jgi:hypothetical protein